MSGVGSRATGGPALAAVGAVSAPDTHARFATTHPSILRNASYTSTATTYTYIFRYASYTDTTCPQFLQGAFFAFVTSTCSLFPDPQLLPDALRSSLDADTRTNRHVPPGCWACGRREADKDTTSYARSGFRTGMGRDVGTNADPHVWTGQRSSNTRCADANDDLHARDGRQQ